RETKCFLNVRWLCVSLWASSHRSGESHVSDGYERTFFAARGKGLSAELPLSAPLSERLPSRWLATVPGCVGFVHRANEKILTPFIRHSRVDLRLLQETPDKTSRRLYCEGLNVLEHVHIVGCGAA